MSTVTIVWTVRAASRWPGTVETVERTPFIDAIIKQGRAEVLEESGTVFLAPVDPELVALVVGDPAEDFLSVLTEAMLKPIEPELIEAGPFSDPHDHPESSEALGLTAPKPRRPRRDSDEA